MTLPTRRVWIASYGGSGTNYLNNMLRARNEVVDRDWWGPGPCHAPAPIRTAPCTAAVYVYRHPVAAYLSQCRRGLEEVNQRKLGSPGPEFTAARFAEAQVRQMRAWRDAAAMGLPFPVVLARYETLPAHMAEMARDIGVDPFPDSFTPGQMPRDDRDGAFSDAVDVWRAMPDYLLIPPTGAGQ